MSELRALRRTLGNALFRAAGAAVRNHGCQLSVSALPSLLQPIRIPSSDAKYHFCFRPAFWACSVRGEDNCTRETRELVPNVKRSCVAGVALTAFLFGFDAYANYATGAVPKTDSNWESGVIALTATGLSGDEVRCSTSTRAKSSSSLPELIMLATSSDVKGASIKIANSQSLFSASLAREIATFGCRDSKDDRFQSAKPKLILNIAVDGAVPAVNTSRLLDSSVYMAVAAENPASGPNESTGRRVMEVRSRKQSNFIAETNAMTSPGPEPELYTMMLTGLGLMGFVASRRQP